MPADLDPIAVLRRTDPAAGRPVPDRPLLDELVALPMGPPAPPGSGRSVTLVAAAALLVVLTVAALLSAVSDEPTDPPVDRHPVPWGPAAPDEATLDIGREPLARGPAEPAGPELFALADVAEADRASLPTDLVAYRRTAGWTTTTTTGPDSTVTERDGEQQETWSAPGEPMAHRTEGFALRPPASGSFTVALPRETSELAGTSLTAPSDVWDLPPKVDDVLALLQQGARAGEQDHGLTWGTLEQAATVLGGPLTGSDRATLLRALATIDLVSHGSITDRAGRRGIAIAAGSLRSSARYELVVVLDPDSGALLAVEEVAPAGEQLAADGLPAADDDEREVTTSTTVLTADWVDEPGERPET